MGRIMVQMSSNPADRTLLTRREVAGELRISPKTLSRWIEDGKLPVVRLPSGRFRIRRSELEAALKQEAD